ncbi:MAG TPA: hypothetical protein VF133_01640 [Terriglobales bacterium]
MKARGKVLREPNAGPGLVMIDGQQFRFWLDGIWRSETLPTRGLAVEVELDQSLQVTGMTPIPEPQVARDQVEAVLSQPKHHRTEIAHGMVHKIGPSAILAAGLLLIGWFFLGTLSIPIPLAGTVNLTFWQLLGLVNTPRGLEAAAGNENLNAGMYAVFAAIALTGPFFHHFWNDKRAFLGGAAPLVFMLVIWFAAGSTIHDFFLPGGAGPYAEIAQEAGSEAMKNVSFSFGGYLSAMVGAYFAWTGLRHFFSAQTVGKQSPESSRPAAA